MNVAALSRARAILVEPRVRASTIRLKPVDDSVFHSLLQLLVNVSAVELVGWPVPAAYQRAIDARAILYRPHDIPAEELPNAKAVARAINRVFRNLYVRGWRVIGCGSSAVVFGHPAHDYVLRLRHTPCRRDPWLEYARWAQANCMRSPAVPRISRIVKFESGPFFTFLAKVERLRKVTECPLALERARNARVAFEDDLDFLYTSEERHNARESLPLSITSVLEEVRRSVFNGERHYIDLQQANLMLRASDQQLVINDPISLKIAVRPKH